VLGLGGIGSAALYHLAARGLRVIGLEQFGIAHERGSSHGQTRLIRQSYFEHSSYVPLVRRAEKLWVELESQTGKRLLERTGLYLAGPTSGVIVPGVLRAAAAYDIGLERLSHTDARSRFPGFRPSDEMAILFEPDAGCLAVEDCVATYVAEASRLGAAVHSNDQAIAWSAEPDEVKVKTEQMTYRAAQLIICAGSWTSKLLENLRFLLEVRRKTVVWVPIVAESMRKDRGCPVFGFEHEGRFFYGFPCTDGATVKVGEHTGGGSIRSPEELDRSLHPTDVEPVADFIRRFVPGLEPRAVKHSVCMYTMTPDEHFIIDRHPEHSNVVYAAGFSGHGFKFASVIGSVLADLVTTGTTSEPIGFLRADRPSLQHPR